MRPDRGGCAGRRRPSSRRRRAGRRATLTLFPPGRYLLRGRAAVDDEPGAGHEAGIVGGEKDNALGDVVRHAEAADRKPRHRWC